MLHNHHNANKTPASVAAVIVVGVVNAFVPERDN